MRSGRTVCPGAKSAAAPATVSGELSVHSPHFEAVTEPSGFGKAGSGALTREPGDLPSSHKPTPPGGVNRRHGDDNADVVTSNIR